MAPHFHNDFLLSPPMVREHSSNNTHLSALNCTRLFLPLTTTTTTAHSSSSGPTTPSPVPLTTKCQRSRQVTPTHPAKKACSLNLPRLWPFFAHAILEVLQFSFSTNQAARQNKKSTASKNNSAWTSCAPSLFCLLACLLACCVSRHGTHPGASPCNQPASHKQAGRR